jgi:gluconolactonase
MPANCFEVLDDRFRRLFVPTAAVDVLFTGCRWAEGPAYFPAARSLVWSDIICGTTTPCGVRLPVGGAKTF